MGDDFTETEAMCVDCQDLCIINATILIHDLIHLCDSEVISSQPVHKSDTDGDNVASIGARGAVIVESFTQPSRFDELIIGTQIPCTPGASQVHQL
jgi:hypothetical protein